MNIIIVTCKASEILETIDKYEIQSVVIDSDSDCSYCSDGYVRLIGLSRSFLLAQLEAENNDDGYLDASNSSCLLEWMDEEFAYRPDYVVFKHRVMELIEEQERTKP